MGLYNMVFGENPVSEVVLAALELTPGDFRRFRDVHIGNGEIAVYTRLGGGNRECECDDDAHYCYQETIRAIQGHPDYLRDEDDDYDNTYATFYFRFPEKYAADLKNMDSGEEWKPSERWQEFISALQKGGS